jgi:hypothetical protein
MCLEDKRLGRETGSAEYLVAIPVGKTQLVGPNPLRVSLTIFPPDTSSIHFTSRNEAVAGQGIFLQAGQAPVCLTIEEHGNIVTWAWYANATAGTLNVPVIEATLGKE